MTLQLTRFLIEPAAALGHLGPIELTATALALVIEVAALAALRRLSARQPPLPERQVAYDEAA
jgi:hypothetical protein